MSLERVDAPSNILEKINISATANVVDPAHDPEKMSLALAAGLLLAMIPMLGGASILALVVAAVFRLNQVATHVAN